VEEQVRSVWVLCNGVGSAMCVFGALHALAFMWIFEHSMDTALSRLFLLCLGIVSAVTHTHAAWLFVKEVDRYFFPPSSEEVTPFHSHFETYS